MLNPYWSKRHRPPCNRIFEGVLVLKWDAVGDFNDGRKRHSVACEGVMRPSGTLPMTMVAVAGWAQTHLKHPGSPARVARQEKELTKSYRVHVAGCSANAVTRGAL